MIIVPFKIMWKNMAELYSPRMATQICAARVRFACRITKERIRKWTQKILCFCFFFIGKQWLRRERAAMLRYMYIVSLVNFLTLVT